MKTIRVCREMFLRSLGKDSQNYIIYNVYGAYQYFLIFTYYFMHINMTGKYWCVPTSLTITIV